MFSGFLAVAPSLRILNPFAPCSRGKIGLYRRLGHNACRDGDLDTMSIKISVPTFMPKRVFSADFYTFSEKALLRAKTISGLQRCFFAFLWVLDACMR